MFLILKDSASCSFCYLGLPNHLGRFHHGGVWAACDEDIISHGFSIENCDLVALSVQKMSSPTDTANMRSTENGEKPQILPPGNFQDEAYTERKT